VAGKTLRSTIPDTYFDLVRRLSLVRIRDNKHLSEARTVAVQLIVTNLDRRGAEEYLEVLTDLIESYEDEHVPIPDASEAEALRELMRLTG
jgi:hypothetical protein